MSNNPLLSLQLAINQVEISLGDLRNGREDDVPARLEATLEHLNEAYKLTLERMASGAA